MKKTLVSIALLGASLTMAQVGINTEEPKATLDVVASPGDLTKTDGFIAPRLTGDELRLKNALYNAPDQTGAVIYATAADSAPAGKTINVTEEGYYYFDGSVWVKFGSGTAASGTEPWYVQNTSTEATSNTENIYQQGKVAVGFSNTDAVSGKQFEVKGDMKAVYDNGAGTYNIIDNNYDYYMGAKANMILSSDDEDVNSATKANFVFSSNDISNSGIVSVDGGLTSGAFASTNTILGHAILSAIDNTNDVNANVGAVSFGRVTISGGSMSGTGNFTEVMVDRTDGVRFRFGDSSGSNTGQYLFPKTNGSANQVLTTNGSAGTANLFWQDVSTLAPEPWRIQGTTNPATSNTQNIYQAGNVSIGSQDPIAPFTSNGTTITPKLSVTGDVASTGAFYTTTGKYADYVFEDYFDGSSTIYEDYKFMSLDETAAYIKENKHLPGVTPIKDVLKTENGYTVNLSELSIQQLEKIEELYLHTIEQQQEIENQKKEINDLKSRFEVLEALLLKENNNK